MLAGLALWPPSTPAAEPSPPETVTRLALVVDGQEVAVFSELGGIASCYEPVQLELTSGPTAQLKLPGKRTPPTVVLKRGMTRALMPWTWHEQALDRCAVGAEERLAGDVQP